MVPYSLAIEHTPTVLRRILADVRPERFSERITEDRFSLVEMVAHMADWEDIVLDRLRAAVEHPGSPVDNFDIEARAAEKRYAERDLQHELDVLENRRRDTVDFLRNITPDQWSLSFVHPERGEVSIQNQVSMLVGHDLYHLEQATQYMK
ncbi:MAG: DinB family protein [Fimbriimonas sp.]